jgi:hypothetical protein
LPNASRLVGGCAVGIGQIGAACKVAERHTTSVNRQSESGRLARMLGTSIVIGGPDQDRAHPTGREDGSLPPFMATRLWNMEKCRACDTDLFCEVSNRAGKIVVKLDLIAEEIRLAALFQRKLVAFDDLKKSLLHQIFTGQL